MKLAVLGLGNMGLPVARNLALAGHDVTGANIVPVPEAEEAGVRVTTVAEEALVDRDVVLCLLPDLPYLEPMLPALLESGATDLIVMSTISPTAVRELAHRLAGRIEVIDACMSGGVAKATDGTMSIMCGGSEEAFARVLPILHVIGGTVERMGDVGAGAVAKACNQMVVVGTLVSLAEAALVAKDNALDARKVFDVLGSGLAASELLEQKKDKLADEDFSPSGPAKFLVKDLRFAVDSAAGRELPVLTATRALYDGLTAAGLGDFDNTVVMQYLRQLTEKEQ